MQISFRIGIGVEIRVKVGSSNMNDSFPHLNYTIKNLEYLHCYNSFSGCFKII